MARARAVLGALGLWSAGLGLCSGLEAFAPFAGLDELRPRPMAEFCSDDVEASATKDGQRLRWCQHSFRRTLEDEGEVELGWRMRVDPDAVLSLDAEADARALACGPGWLELELPSQRAERLAPGHLVLASRFAHACPHLEGGQLYGRVTGVRATRSGGSGAAGGAGSASRLRLAVEELPSFAHVVPSLSFHFSYMPAEARDVVKYPTMRTNFGANRDHLEKRRRLKGSHFFDNLMSKLKGLAHAKGIEKDDGGFTHGAKSHTTMSNKNNLLSLMPKKLSNFGWNWNFFMNTTENPNYEFKLPGAEGKVKLRHPYIKIHAGIYLNFTSEFAGLTPPKVQWTAGVHGHGYFQARVLATMNTTASAKVDPFATKSFQLPMLESLSAPQWFQKMDMALGSMPVSMEPGFQFNARMYHSGTFHGALAVGGRTHGVFNPTLSYDSKKGFDVSMQATLHDTDVWPPFWMIFTKRFELGVIFEPSILLRGDFAGLKKSTVAIDMHPYLNLTISRENETEADESEPSTGERSRTPVTVPAAMLPAARPATDDGLRALTVYPLRIVGLNSTAGPRQYKVRIDIGGEMLETQPQMNWGQVSFHEHISHFSVGRVSERVAVAEPIVVTLIGIGEGPAADVTEVIGWGEVRCKAFEDGRCSPSPMVAHIQKGGGEIAAVELAVLWDDAPELWLASQLRAAAVDFSEVFLREGALDAVGSPGPLTLRFVHGGIAHVVPLVEGGRVSLPGYSGTTTVELAPNLLQDWRPCGEGVDTKCEPTRVELYRGTAKVAAADVPQVDWSQQAPAGNQQGGAFLAPGASSAKVLAAPILLPLHSMDGEADSIAVVKMIVKMALPTSAALFFRPSGGEQMPLGGGFPQSFEWTIGGVREEEEYTFNLTVLRKTGMVADSWSADSLFPSVQGQALAPVPGGRYEIRQQCVRRPLGSLPAEESPCSFLQVLSFGSQHVPGEQVAVLLQWQQDGLGHELLSPAFETVASTTPSSVPRRLWSKDAWNARVNSHKSCAKKDLHFRLGAGMLVRGRIEKLGLPEDYPAFGNVGDDQPVISTGYRKVVAVRPGTDARELLPEELCAGGLCKGALPGCTEASFEKKHWPLLKFNFNRKFHYSAKSKGKFHGLMKEALAFAFSALPEALAVALDKVNKTGSKEALTTTLPPLFGNMEAGMVEWPSRAPARPLSYVPMASESTSTTKVPFYKRWWDGTQRRLQGSSHTGGERVVARSGPAAGSGGVELDINEAPEEHQVTMHFKQGVPFVIDRELLDMMVHHGYFMEVEDDASHEHGPLRVTSVHVEGGGEAAAEETQRERWAADAGAAPAIARRGAGALAAGLGALALLAAAALLPRRRPRSYEAAAATLAEEKGVE